MFDIPQMCEIESEVMDFLIRAISEPVANLELVETDSVYVIHIFGIFNKGYYDKRRKN